MNELQQLRQEIKRATASSSIENLKLIQKLYNSVVQEFNDADLEMKAQLIALKTEIDHFPTLLEALKTGPEGQKGTPGERGERGADGKDGIGRDGRDGQDGRDGIDGKDGTDGSDADLDGDEIITRINDSEDIIDKERVEGLKDIEAKADMALSRPTGSGGGGGASGVKDILGGTNITVNEVNEKYTVNLDSSLTAIDAIYFNTAYVEPAHVEGQVHWNDDDKTLELDTEVSGTSIQVGQEQVLRATNKTGVNITNGSVVYIDGAQGNRPTIALADADLEETARATIGLVTADIDNNATGYVTEFGLVRDVDTGSFSVGDILYLSQTAGGYTNVAPAAPAHAVKIGIVTVSNVNEGVILVDVDNGSDIDELHDVLLTNLADGDMLQYDSGASVWKNEGNPTRAIETITASSDTLDTNNYTVLCDCSSNAITINLPAAASNTGRVYNIKKIDATGNTVVIDANASETIDGQTTITIINQYVSITVQSNGTNWFII